MLSDWQPKLAKGFDTAYTSFWFIPLICITMSFLLLAATHWLDSEFQVNTRKLFHVLYDIEPEGARTVLATIASAIITVTSIAFSMIVVTLTLASSQFGPRLLRTFMQDQKTKLSLGVFLATFTYSLALIRFVNAGQPDTFVPGVGLGVSLLLAVISVFTLVFLIHHVATSIQADNVIEQCWYSLARDLHNMFPSHSQSKKESSESVDWSIWVNRQPLVAKQDGYIQIIQIESLMSCLCIADAGLALSIKPGKYVVKGENIGTVYSQSDDDIGDMLGRYISIGRTRTPLQDPEFAIMQMVELALRALSPGINDPHTAITCLHRLGSAMCLLSHCEFPSSVVTDKDGVARLQHSVIGFEGIVCSACDQIRQSCLAHPSVIIAMLETLTTVVQQCDKQQKTVVFQQGDLLYQQVVTASIPKADKDDIAQRYDALIHAAHEQ